MSRERYRSQAPAARTTASTVSASSGPGGEVLDRHRRHVLEGRQVDHALRQLQQLSDLAEGHEGDQQAPARRTVQVLRSAKQTAASAVTSQTAGAWASAEGTSSTEGAAGRSVPHRDRGAGDRAAARWHPTRATTSVAMNEYEREVAVASTCSVRPSCSSVPPWPTTAMAKQLTTTAATLSSAAIRVSCEGAHAAEALHHAARASASPAGRRSAGRWPRAPRPCTAMATVQVTSIGVCTRRLSAMALDSRGDPSAGPGRAASMPDPRSRRARRSWASPVRTPASDDVQEQHPPARVAVRPQLGRPAEGGEPAEPRDGGVAHGPQHEQPPRSRRPRSPRRSAHSPRTGRRAAVPRARRRARCRPRTRRTPATRRPGDRATTFTRRPAARAPRR